MTKDEMLARARAFMVREHGRADDAEDREKWYERLGFLVHFITAELSAEPTPEPAVVVPELVWNSCGPGNGGLWDCPDSIDCAGYCSPPWTFDKATQEHQRRHREWVAEETKRRALNREVPRE